MAKWKTFLVKMSFIVIIHLNREVSINCHIWAKQVCVTVMGMIFMQFSLGLNVVIRECDSRIGVSRKLEVFNLD